MVIAFGILISFCFVLMFLTLSSPQNLFYGVSQMVGEEICYMDTQSLCKHLVSQVLDLGDKKEEKLVTFSWEYSLILKKTKRIENIVMV